MMTLKRTGSWKNRKSIANPLGGILNKTPFILVFVYCLGLVYLYCLSLYHRTPESNGIFIENYHELLTPEKAYLRNYNRISNSKNGG
jgi:hypothetical protein